MKIVVRFILLFVLFWGCSNDKIKQDIRELQSKAISFPQYGEITIQGRDTLIPDFMQVKLKLVVYTDSIDCSSCVISKMYLWNDFIEKGKLYEDRLRFYYILSPQRQHIEKIRLALSTIDFNYPVLLDTLGEFEKLNPHLPKNKVLHTFLLDENNRVILVGSPLNNSKIKEMFYRVVEERLGKPEQSVGENN